MRNFRKMLLTIILCFLIAVFGSGLIMMPYFCGENYYYQDIREREELSGSLDFLISGTSHSMSVLDPDILDEEMGTNSYNLSFANASMDARYELLSMEIERNPVDTVVIGLSYDSLTGSREYRGYEGYFYLIAKMKARDRTPYFFEVIKPSEYLNFYSQCLSWRFECIKRLIRGTWTSTNELAERGFYLFQLEEPDEDWLKASYAEEYNTESLSEEFDKESLEWLQKMVDLCKENDIQVILYTVPLSEAAVCVNDNLDTFREWYDYLADEWGVTYIDFNLYKEGWELFSDEEDFSDRIQMKREGADKFSLLFSQIYQSIQNGKDVSDLFYDSYAELEANADYTP